MDDLKNYKLGIFYFNPADSRLLVPRKRMQGYTLNFGKPASMLLSVLFLAILIAVIYSLLKF
jgi:uncharacterized membrane protein